MESADNDNFRRPGIDAENVSADPIGQVEHAATICRDALNNHGAIGTRRIEIDEYRYRWTTRLRGYAGGQYERHESQ